MQNRKSKNLLDIVPIYSPRTTFNNVRVNDERMIADMTLNFDKITIGLLKQQFQKLNYKLSLQQFIILARKHLKFWQPQLKNRQQCLIRYLSQLFKEIDINGNGFMEWKQFTNYIVQKAIVLKNLKTKSEEIKKYVKSDIEPKLKIDTIIQKAQYIKDIQKMAFFQEGSCKVYFMDVKDGAIWEHVLQIDPKKLIISISSIKKNKNRRVEIRKKDLQIPTEVRVLDILYLNDKKYKTLLISTSDGYVRGWKYTQNGFVLATQPDNEQEMFQHSFNSQIYCLSWDSVNEVLYCGQKCGSIYMWNLKTDLQKALYQHSFLNTQKKSNEQSINQMITNMITMPKLQFMASGRMDGKLILWDTINNKKKWVYRQHTRGILSLAFNESMILLFSAGFDHKICVWNPYISSLIHKIQIHIAPIICLRVIQSSNQLISLDSQGLVKITDTKRFNNIYSFSIQKQQTSQLPSSCQSLSSFISISTPLKLIFIGKSISMYQYDKNYNPHTADQNVTICCKYVKQMMCFITASGNKIKVWSALNGDVNKIFIDVAHDHITAMALDTLEKRIILGDLLGNVSVHNVLNGAKMKQLLKHQTEILELVTLKTDVEMLIACSIDNQIRIYKENDDNYQIVRYIYFRKDIRICHLKYQSNIKLLMVATNVGTVGFYDAQTGKNIGNCLNKCVDEITSVNMTKQSFMITTTASGKINLFAIPPLNTQFSKMLTFSHKDCEKPIACELGITTSCYNSNKNLLYLVDDKSYLSCYDFSQVKQYSHLIKQVTNDCDKQDNFKFIVKNIKFPIKWQLETNHQAVKTIQFFQAENLLCTTSYDKKVKFWSADTGQYIDSLQQNYNKSLPEPIAYYDTRNCILYSKNKKKAIDHVNIDITKFQLQFDYLTKIMLNYDQLKQQSSNQQWNIKVQIGFKQRQQKSRISQFCQKLSKTQQKQKLFNKTCFASLHSNKVKNFKHIHQNLQRYKNELKIVQKQLFPNKQVVDSQIVDSEQRASSSNRQIQIASKTQQNFYRRSLLKDISNTKKSILKVKHMKSINMQIKDNGYIKDNGQIKNNQQIKDNQQTKDNTQIKDNQQTKDNTQIKDNQQTKDNTQIKNNQQTKDNQSFFANQLKQNKQNKENKENKQNKTYKTNKTNKQINQNNHDFTPIYQVLGFTKKKKAFQQHRKVTDSLHKNQTLSIINGRNDQTVYLNQKQAKATYRLCQALLKIDCTDKRPQTLVKSIKIKQPVKSIHVVVDGLPKI